MDEPKSAIESYTLTLTVLETKDLPLSGRIIAVNLNEDGSRDWLCDVRAKL